METSCALINLVRTRARGNRESMEDKRELEEDSHLRKPGLTKIKSWNLSVKRRFQINDGECLIDPNYKYKSNLILDSNEYKTALSNH